MPPMDYLPAGNRNLLFVFMRVPPGNNLEQNERLVKTLRRLREGES